MPPTGREKQYEIYLEGIPYRVVKTEDAPVWNVRSVPEVSSRQPQQMEEERRMISWHAGFGWAYMMAPHVYHYALNADLRSQQQIIMGPAVTSITVSAGANITRLFEFRGTLYCAGGRDVFTIAANGDVVEVSDSTNPAANVLDVEIFDNTAVFALGLTTVAVTYNTSTWTALTGINASYLTKGNFDGDHMLIRSYNNSNRPSIIYVPSGTALTPVGNWINPYPVGDTSETTTAVAPITGLATVANTIWVAKADGLYYVDVYGESPKTIPFYNRNTNNGLGLVVDTVGTVWVPTVEGYYRYDHINGTVEDASPGRGLPNASPICGRITAQTQYRGWRYAAVYDGTDTYIMCGRERTGNDAGVGSMTWHGALVKVTGAVVNDMIVTSLYNSRARLYYTVATNAAWMDLPLNGDNPLLDASYTYATSANVYLPADDWAVPGTRFQLTAIEIDNNGLSATTYVDVYAQLDDGNWGYVGRADTDGQATIYPSNSAEWLFGRCALRLDITNASSASTPIIRSVVARAVRRSKVRDLISTKVYCSDRIRSLYSLPTKMSGADQLLWLKLFAESSPATLTDYWTGSSYTRKVLVQPVQETISRQEGTDSADLVVSLDMLVLSDDAEFSDNDFYYDSADYGSAIWG